jgi:hypothetical protein
VTDTARKLLFDRQYDNALAAYQRIPDELLTDSLRFERAVLLLKRDNPSLALRDLSQLTDTYQGGKNWYMALAYLKQGNSQKVRALLLVIVQSYSTSPYGLEAKELLEEM